MGRPGDGPIKNDRWKGGKLEGERALLTRVCLWVISPLFQWTYFTLPSLKLTTNMTSHLKVDGWRMIVSFLLGQFRPIFRGKLAVRFMEGT